MDKEKSCGCIIIESEKVLLVKHIGGHWGFPKGHVEGNETEMETAIREVKEETNIEVEIINDNRYSEEYVTDRGNQKEVVYFIAKKVSGTIKMQEEELVDIEWFDFKEAVKMLTYDNTRDMFKKLLKEQNITV